MKGKRRFGGARAAARVKDENKKLRGFGKKWNSGDTIWVFYPLAKFMDEEDNEYVDVVVGGEYGYKVDKELKLKKFFVPAFGKRDEETGKPLEVTWMDRAAQVASLLKLGKKAQKIATIKAKTNDPDMLQEALTEIEDEFKNNVRAVISAMSYVSPTECVVIPVKGGTPVDVIGQEGAELVSQDLSSDRSRILGGFIASSDYGITADSKWLEVKYTFKSSGNKNKDGDVAPVAVTPANSLAVKYPEIYAKIEPLLNSLPQDGEMVNKRNMGLLPIEESKVRQAFQKYLLFNSEALEALEKEEDISRLVKCHETLEFFQTPIKNEKYNTELKKYLAKKALEEAEGATEISEEAKEVEGTGTGNDEADELNLNMNEIIANAEKSNESNTESIADKEFTTEE